MQPHIFFTGEKGVGKSTLVAALLRGKRKIGGFRTVKKDGAVYLLRPDEEIAAENRMFFCRQTQDAASRFDVHGCAALEMPAEVIVMDELGSREENAMAFQAAVFRVLDGDTPVVGVLQRADSSFLRRVAEHPKVRLIEVTRENRDTLYRELVGQIVGGEVRHFTVLDSTNDALKHALAAGDAPDGLAVLADEQTAGRGRRGRQFFSAAGKGLYASVLLQPNCDAVLLPTLTAWAAVAVHDAIEKVCGVSAAIKWPNDLVVGGKKLCGILTELVTMPKPSVILGIGINLTQTAADFGTALAPIAVSLAQVTGEMPDTSVLTAALWRELDTMYRAFPQERETYLCRYRALCLTRGTVRVLTPTGEKTATAEKINGDFSLRVRYGDGRTEDLHAGEVSVRGICADDHYESVFQFSPIS